MVQQRKTSCFLLIAAMLCTRCCVQGGVIKKNTLGESYTDYSDYITYPPPRRQLGCAESPNPLPWIDVSLEPVLGEGRVSMTGPTSSFRVYTYKNEYIPILMCVISGDTGDCENHRVHLFVKKVRDGNIKILTVGLKLIELNSRSYGGYFVRAHWTFIKPVICPFKVFAHPRNTECRTDYVDGDAHLTISCHNCNVLPSLECQLVGSYPSATAFIPAPAKKCSKPSDMVTHPGACKTTLKLVDLSPDGEIPLKVRAGRIPQSVSPWQQIDLRITMSDVKFSPECTNRSAYNFNPTRDWLETSCTCYIPDAKQGEHVEWFVNDEPVHHNTTTIVVRMMLKEQHGINYQCVGHGPFSDKYPNILKHNRRTLQVPYDEKPIIFLNETTCPKRVTIGQMVDCHCVLGREGSPSARASWFDSNGVELEQNYKHNAEHWFACLTFPTLLTSAETRTWKCKAASVTETTAPADELVYEVTRIDSDIYLTSLDRGTSVVVMMCVTIGIIFLFGAWLHFKSTGHWLSQNQRSTYSSVSSRRSAYGPYRTMAEFKPKFRNTYQKRF